MKLKSKKLMNFTTKFLININNLKRIVNKKKDG